MIELRNEGNEIIDRGDGWKDPEQGYVITSCLDQKDHVYNLDNVTEFFQIEYNSEESDIIYNYYDVMRGDNDLTKDDIEYVHYNEVLNPNVIFSVKILRHLGYTKEYSLEEIKDLEKFKTKYKSIINKKHKETQKKIKDLILDEKDQLVKTEYESILKDLKTSVSDFCKKLNETDFEYPEDIIELWPTLLNPSPFTVFKDTLR